MKTIGLQPKIGIVSGIGPLAGSDVLAKVFQHAAMVHGAVEDVEYPDVLLLNHGIEGVDNTGTLNTAFEDGLTDMVNQLELQDANIIGMACNTAHLYFDKIKITHQLNLINLIDEVAVEAAKYGRSYLLLTSNTSKKQKLYHSYLAKHEVAFVETTQRQQELLDETIGLVMAHKLDQAGWLMEKVLSLASEAGYSAVIAGCTELPIAISHCSIPDDLEIIDSNYILAKALTDYYYQQIMGNK